MFHHIYLNSSFNQKCSGQSCKEHENELIFVTDQLNAQIKFL